jgi:oligosaccharide repeat unit polymerase
MTILGPMLLYVYVYSPMTRISSGSLLEFFPDAQELVYVQLVQLVSVVAFCLGCTWYRRPPGIDQRFSMLRQQIPLRTRLRMLSLVSILGTVACGSFLYMVSYSGGWIRVFSEAKPFIRAPSGYIGELPMLSYPAIFILSFAFQGRRLTTRRVAAMIIVMFPHIVMATLGGRRGPMFLASCTFFGAWCIINQRRPRVKTVLAGLATVGCLMLLLQGNRANLFRPWEEEIDTSFVEQLWSPPVLNAGDEYVVAAATVLTTSKYGHYYWGARYFATFFVRPIPRFIWPTKYEDMGLGWMETNPGKSGIPTSQWLDCVGFEPAGGSAGGFVADLFLEFSWGCAAICFLLGLLFSSVWRKWTTCGELWTLIYFEFMVLSVYLIAQSLGAWLYRVVFVVTLTWAFWKWNSLGSRPSKRRPHRPLPPHWRQPAVPVSRLRR